MFKNILIKHIYLTCVFTILMMGSVTALEKTPDAILDVQTVNHAGQKIDLNVMFKDSTGAFVSASSIFDGKHIVLLNFVYYSCPNLCHFLLDGVQDVLARLDPMLYPKIRVVTVSFEPTDTVDSSKQFKERYAFKDQPIDWEFYTADAAVIESLTRSVGFRYQKDPKTGEYAHAPLLTIVSKDGTISRYLQDIRFDPFELKLAIIDSLENKHRSILERALLFCYNYNSDDYSYSIQAVRLMKVAGFITGIALLLWVIILLKRKG